MFVSDNNDYYAVGTDGRKTIDFNVTYTVKHGKTIKFTSNIGEYEKYVNGYRWEFGDKIWTKYIHMEHGGNDIYYSVEHTYAKYGTYNVTLTLFLSEECPGMMDKMNVDKKITISKNDETFNIVGFEGYFAVLSFFAVMYFYSKNE